MFLGRQSKAPTAIRIELAAIFVSLELSKSTWVITSLSPGGGERMSKHAVLGGDIAAPWARFVQLQEKAQASPAQFAESVIAKRTVAGLPCLQPPVVA